MLPLMTFPLVRTISSFLGRKEKMSHPNELPLVGLNELRTIDRWRLENRARALAQAINLGDGLMLCRVLGRYKLYVPASDVGFGVHVLMEGIWEGWLTVVMTHLIQPGMTVVDVGANHGYYTVLFADLVGAEGKVVAFEPHPVTANLLRKTLFVNGMQERVEVVEAAAVAVDGTDIDLFGDASEPKNASVVSWGLAEYPLIGSVRGVTLDTALASAERVDFMKVDVEGAEEQTMLGAMKIIARDKPDIVLEYNVHRCTDPERLLNDLETYYGRILIINYDSTLETVARATLLDRTRTDDWSLFLTVRAPLPLAMAED